MTQIKAYVLGGAGDRDVCSWLEKFSGAEIVTKLTECNLLVFVGGADVTPGLYGEQRVDSQIDYLRDKQEQQVFDFAVQTGIPMLGICRGSQFLHVMNGGKLWQDVTSHAIGSEPGHPMIDVEDGFTLRASSYHHQMVREAWTDGGTAEEHGFVLVAKTPEPRSDWYKSDAGKLCTDTVTEVEAYKYPKTQCFGIQGHPEWGPMEFARWAGVKVVEWHGKLNPTINIDGYQPEAENKAENVNAGDC